MSNKDADIAAALRDGFAALNAGDPRRAADFCRTALMLKRDLPQAHFLMGSIALDMKDLKTAVSAFGSVTKLQPDHAAAWALLARTFMRLAQPARAEHALEKAMAAGTSDPMVEDTIGMTHSLLGDQASAKRWYARACAGAPENPGYAVNLASAQIFLGETAEAQATLTALLARRGDIAQAEWLLSSVNKADDPARARALMAKSMAARDPQSRAFFAYAAGKDFEDCEEWEAAFAAFEAGARAKQETFEYDEAGEEAMFAALRDTFTADWPSRARKGFDDPSPIFVVGQPRTGTTLIERIITSHSMVESAGELQQFGLSVRRLTPGWSPEMSAAEGVVLSTEADLEALGREYLRVSAPMRTGAPRFVDKLPRNYQHIPLILAALPNAKIVHLTRDPMDACFASYKQLFAEAYHHSYDQRQMARHFVRYAGLMETWRERFPGRFLDISYEETVTDFEPQARRLIGFLDLPWEDRCLAFHEQKTAVATASAVQVREKPHARSVGRWRRYEKQLAPMRETLFDAGVITASGDRRV